MAGLSAPVRRINRLCRPRFGPEPLGGESSSATGAAAAATMAGPGSAASVTRPRLGRPATEYGGQAAPPSRLPKQLHRCRSRVVVEPRSAKIGQASRPTSISDGGEAGTRDHPLDALSCRPGGRGGSGLPASYGFGGAVTFHRGQPFEIRKEPTGPSSLTIRLYGEFDLACRERYEAEVARIGENGVRELVIDLAGLTFLDSSAIRMLLQTRRSSDGDGFDLFVILPEDGQVRKVLDLTGVVSALSPQNGG